MKTILACGRSLAALATLFVVLFNPGSARAVITVFFNSSQTTNLVASGTTSDTISSEGYLFTFSRDKLFTGGAGMTNPIGRAVRVPWPQGLEAQAVTAGPSPDKARITIERQDGEPFDLASFTMQLLANTGGAGASLEIMPQLNGEDAFADPYPYDATGYAGQHFSYQTPELTGFDAYVITLYVDYALTSLTLVDASVAPPPRPTLDIRSLGTTVELSWPTNAVGYVLESTTNLSTAVWGPVTNSLIVSGDLFTVPLAPVESHRLYRLRK